MRKKHVQMPPLKFFIKGLHSFLWMWSQAMRPPQSCVKLDLQKEGGERCVQEAGVFSWDCSLEAEKRGRGRLHCCFLIPALRSGCKLGISSSACVERTLHGVYSDSSPSFPPSGHIACDEHLWWWELTPSGGNTVWGWCTLFWVHCHLSEVLSPLSCSALVASSSSGSSSNTESENLWFPVCVYSELNISYSLLT